MIDSRATSHFCFNRASFKTLKAIQNACITLSNHIRLSVHFTGNVELTPELTLQDVLFVPQFKYNLLSISSLTKDPNIGVKFFTDHYIIQDLCSWKMIGMADMMDGLYIINTRIDVMKDYKVDCNSFKAVSSMFVM